MGGSRGLAVHDGIEMSLLSGEHALYVEGSLRAARRWFDVAYQEAEQQGDMDGMARAALGLGGLWVHEHRTAAEAAVVRTRQRQALALVGPQSSLALRLRVRLAGEDDYRSGGQDRILAMVEEARRAGDPVALAEALSLAHHCVLGPEHGALRLALAQELIEEAQRTGRRGDLLMGLLWRTVDLVLAADPHAERALAELRGLLSKEDHLAVGFVVDAMEVMFSIRGGRLSEAEAMAGTCADRGAAAGDIDSAGWYAGQIAAIRWYQGRAAELVPMVTDLVNSPDLSEVDRSLLAVLAVSAATAGERRLAAGALARLRGQDLTVLPRSSTWLISMYGGIEAAYLLGDAGTAAEIYAVLRPFERLPVIVSLGVTCLGSVHHPLGVAMLTCGETDKAIAHLRAAVHENLALGHWPAVVLSRLRLGQALRGTEESRRILALARQEAASMGMALPADCPVPPAAEVVCVRRGRKWRIELDGRSVLVEHIVGMAHLATLLANPGREIPAVDLAAGAAASDAAESAQPVLDEQARQTYKRRLSGLQAEIDEMEAMHDLQRAATLRAERDWLIDELAAATGLAGRARQFAGSEERARIAVGKAIRRALVRIGEADPVIGERLRGAVQTGVRCSYHPA
ncbi:hypothetical protein [Nonomuraea sp. NEAU-A123]|uniref:hypothetical protein n=1 Tax=Nonomuraea sp. NEAU-A123 TaxID=2839649 RepID=UPI0027E055BF|nr:hypothetical protein [Nonomuraea sp. NEAU-A123]